MATGLYFSGGSGSGGLQTVADKAFVRGYGLCGLDPAHSFAEGATDTMANYSSRGGAFPTAPAEVDSGAYLQNGSDQLARGTGSAGTQQAPRLVMLDQQTAFWFGWEFRMATMPTVANGFGLGGMIDPTSATPGCVAIGYDPASNANFWSIFKRNAAAGVDETFSTVAVDGDWHFGEVWTDGSGSYYGSVDSEAAVTMSNAHPFSNLLASPGFFYANNASFAIEFRPPLFIYGSSF